jgi:hypothetical protein
MDRCHAAGASHVLAYGVMSYNNREAVFYAVVREGTTDEVFSVWSAPCPVLDRGTIDTRSDA